MILSSTCQSRQNDRSGPTRRSPSASASYTTPRDTIQSSRSRGFEEACGADTKFRTSVPVTLRGPWVDGCGPLGVPECPNAIGNQRIADLPTGCSLIVAAQSGTLDGFLLPGHRRAGGWFRAGTAEELGGARRQIVGPVETDG